MKQIIKPLAVGLVLAILPIGGASIADNIPPSSRLRTWAEVQANTQVTKSVSHHSNTELKVRELPTMPGFAIQLGAFSSFENAAILVRQLQQKGIQNLFFRKKQVGNVLFHKVVVGPFKERNNALKRWNSISRTHGLKEGYVTSI